MLQQESMSVSRLKNELEKALPFNIDCAFENAYTEFRQEFWDLDDPLLKRWRDAFELAATKKLEEASKRFAGLAEIGGRGAYVALFNLGICCLFDGRIADAAISLERAEAMAKNNDYWLHIYSGITCFALGLIPRACYHWWSATRIRCDEFGLDLIKRFFVPEYNPERMALYPLCRGKGIDVGCGHCKTHPDAIGVDLVAKGEVLATASNVMNKTSQADIVCPGDDLHMFEDGSLDYVVQRHNLEHYQDPIKALQEWIRVLKPGGIIGMVISDDENCDTIRLDSTHKHVFTQSSILRIFELLPSVKLVYMGPLLRHWSFVCVAQKVDNGGEVTFDYPACVYKRERRELQRRIDLYAKNGMHGLASQCRIYLDAGFNGQKSSRMHATIDVRRKHARHQPLYLALDRDNVHGWKICSHNLKKELTRLVPVHDLGQKKPVEGYRHLKGKVVHALTGAGFSPLYESVRGEQNYGYTFFEKFLNERSVENAKRFELVLAGSTWCRDLMLEMGIKNSDVLIQGIDTDLFHAMPSSRRDDRFLIFSGGKFELRKSQDLVLKAVKVIQERHRDVWLVNCWFNSWPASIRTMDRSPHISFCHRRELSWRENMKRLYVENGLDDNRIFTLEMVPHSDLPQIYSQTDIGLFPNRCEGGTNLVLMEYMACGKPVIATNCSGHRDVLTSENALCLNNLRELPIADEAGEEIAVWNEPSLDDLVDRLEYAYFNRTAIQKIGINASEDLRKMTWASTAKRLLKLIHA